MGNVSPTGREPKILKADHREEVKGTPSSKETKASSEAASMHQNAEAFRKFLIEQFGKDYVNEVNTIVNELDELRKSGKFISYSVVKEMMKSVFLRKGTESFEKNKDKIEKIADLFPPETSKPLVPAKEYDPLASQKVQDAMRKELRKSNEITEERIEESDKQRLLEKEQEQKKVVEKKRILEPKKKV